MIKKIVYIAVIFVLFISFGFSRLPEKAYGYAGVGLGHKKVYKAVGYKRHDCVLTSNVYMIRRSLIMKGSSKWKDVTNTTLRPKACTSKHSSSLKYTYNYRKDGLSYKVKHGILRGSKGKKVSRLKNLLKKHPEGIVVRGRDRRGYGHGILLTKYKNGKFYGVDSAQNKDGFNKGILRMSKTTVPNVSSLVHIWYLEDIKGTAKTSITDAKVADLDAETGKKEIQITWSEPEDGCKLTGYRIYRSNSRNGKYKLIGKTKKERFTVDNENDDKTYYFKIKGYRSVNGKRIYTKEEIIRVYMEKEDLSFNIPAGKKKVVDGKIA